MAETFDTSLVDTVLDIPIVMPPGPASPSGAATAILPTMPDGAALDQIDRALDEVDELSQLLATDASYFVEPLDFETPPDFKLSVVMPVYNEETTIREIVARVLALPLPIELVVVDDCSTDGTREVLAKLGHVTDLTVVHQDCNQGKGAALRTGFQYVTGDIVIVQDADLEYDPRDIPRVMKPILQGDCDVSYGSRFLQQRHAGSSLVHQLGNRLLTAVSNLTTGLKLTDMETCYKAFRRDVLSDLPLRQNRFGIEPELTAKIARRGHCVTEVPIDYAARDWHDGKKINFKDGLSALYCIVRYWWRD